MKAENVRPEDLEWVCGNAIGRLRWVRSPSNTWATSSRRASRMPGCGFVLISEALALGKIAEVEQILEDK